MRTNFEVRVLVICGVSGSGKTMLEKNLINSSKMFVKWEQVTTRPMRPNEVQGDPYTFTSEERFEKIKHMLVGRLGCSENSHFKDKYGSIPVTIPNVYHTVILAEEGLLDLFEAKKDGRIPHDTKIIVIGLDKSNNELVERDGRDLEFLNKERSVLKYADKVFINSNRKYLEAEDVINFLSKFDHEFFEFAKMANE